MDDLGTSVRRDVDSDVTVIDVHGTLGPSTTVIMREVLGECVAECPSAVVVDLTACSAVAPAAVAIFAAPATRQAGRPEVAVLLVDAGRRYAARGGIGAAPVPGYGDLGSALAAVAADRSRAARVFAGLHRSLDAPGRARDIVGAACVRWGIDHLTRNAQLIASELVTNAVIHAGTDVDIELSLRGDFLHLRVRDGGIAPPVPATADGTVAEMIDHGRGLAIVRSLSTSWGFVVSDNADGKVVWATLQLRPARARPGPRAA